MLRSVVQIEGWVDAVVHYRRRYHRLRFRRCRSNSTRNGIRHHRCFDRNRHRYRQVDSQTDLMPLATTTKSQQEDAVWYCFDCCYC